MDTSQTFDTFKNHIAKALSCHPSTLPVVKFEWKFENQAQNAPKKTIADHSGYEALLDAVKAKRATANIVVWLYTPKPLNDEEWDEGGPDGIAKPFSVDRTMDNTSSEPGLSHKGQIESMAAQSSEARLMLLDKYPPGNVKMFPLKRVWHDTKNNRYFELTPIRLQVWAAAIANHKDGVGFETPPHSAHFADSGKLKVPTNSSPEVEGGTLASSSTSTCRASPAPRTTSQFPAVATGYSMPYYLLAPPPYMRYVPVWPAAATLIFPTISWTDCCPFPAST
ncbi:hypothetical protein EDD15DRAFT_1578607 [Pisolithus albus]|nr:hypothetical protein EDD15DRAFT_1578607 [Pisolithus albus]